MASCYKSFIPRFLSFFYISPCIIVSFEKSWFFFFKLLSAVTVLLISMPEHFVKFLKSNGCFVCINLFITYFARADIMLLPFTRGQITYYCPRKMLFPWGQITRSKLCFYYTCKFGVISIKYVIKDIICYSAIRQGI